MDIQAYLKRISYSESPAPTPETLRALHLAHLLRVPFENLSIHWGEAILLDEAHLFDKIVNRRRGGFCYELNGLFGRLLEGLGFEVHRLSAGVGRGDGSFGPDFDHLVLRVAAGGISWLADVGFGDSFRLPLRLGDPGEQADGQRRYRIEPGEPFTILYERKPGHEPTASYRFRSSAFSLGDFTDMCRYHQTSPQSSFTQKLLCSLATPKGRITLSELRLIETNGTQRRESELSSEAEFRQVLQSRFGIAAPDIQPGGLL